MSHSTDEKHTVSVSHRHLGIVAVRCVLTQPGGAVRVEIVSGEHEGCSFAISGEAYNAAIAASEGRS